MSDSLGGEVITDVSAEVEAKARAAKEAARPLATLSTSVKNAALEAMATALGDRQAEILDANQRDLSLAADKGVAEHMRDRLTLNEKRIATMQEGLRQLIALPDPIGEVMGGYRRPNGLQITKVRVPLGVIGIIYESRPNVTVDAASLCLKAGSAVVLRGGSEAIHTNTVLTKIIAEAAQSAGVPAGAISLLENTDRAAVRHLITRNGLVDCIIPRGGASLIETVVKNATVPVIETGTGNCHIYVHESADYQKAIQIVVNAKCSRPSVCNAAETLLLHQQMIEEWGGEFMAELFAALVDQGVQLRVDERVYAVACEYPKFCNAVTLATEEDWHTEFNDLTLAVKIVDDIDEAIAHINHYGTRHSEAIVTEDYNAAQRFIDEVDAAVVYVNASTRFTDGYEFGMGAEIGISNQKLHARGPMGLAEITTTKYVVRGNGQVR